MVIGWKRHRDDWNELAKLDPFYAICTDDSKRGNLWDREEFFESGREEIRVVVDYLRAKAPDLQFESALDFGCGVGRLTDALSKYWSRAVGVDISEEMIALANQCHAQNLKCKFVLNTRSDLGCLPDNSFDFVYSNITLQHIPQESAIRAYITDFVRVLKPGGYGLFQLPTVLPLSRRIKFRRHLYRGLRFFGVPPELLYQKLKLTPMKLMQVSRLRVLSWVEPGALVIEVLNDNSTDTRYLIQKK